MKACTCARHVIRLWKVRCVFVFGKRKIRLEFKSMLEKEKLRKKEEGGSKEALATHWGWFSPQGGLLYSCSDITHKQPLWGIK